MRHLHTYITEALSRLGGGEEGVVYDLGNGKVKKIFSRGRVPIPWQLLYQACCAGVDIVALPKVYEIGDDYIIREDCTPNTARCKAFYKTSQYVPFPKSGPETIYRLVLEDHWKFDGKKTTSDIRMVLTGILKDTIDFLVHLRYELSQVAGPHAGLGDFALKNLGETKDGRVVLFDF